jgi:putative phosphotransacetylase
MEPYEAILKTIMDMVNTNDSGVKEPADGWIPVGVSNRHIHLSKDVLQELFGKEYELTKLKELSQPGQYACEETVTICGPKGAIEKIRILGPVRSKTQVEILAGDSFKLGVFPQPRLSGMLDGTPGITIIGPKGSVYLKEGVIAAQRHIHMLESDARQLGVEDRQNVKVETQGMRGGIYYNVIVRVTQESSLELHVDTEEANAMGLDGKSRVRIVS